MNLTEPQAAAYLGAMIDGEGYVSEGKKRRITITNTDYDLIAASKWCCDVLSIAYCEYLKHGGKPEKNLQKIWVLHIFGRENLQKVYDNVPIQSSKKSNRLRDSLASYIDLDARVPPKEELEHYYFDLQWSYTDIAEHYGYKAASQVCKWFKRYGIKPRSYSAAGVIHHRKHKG